MQIRSAAAGVFAAQTNMTTSSKTIVLTLLGRNKGGKRCVSNRLSPRARP
jgi:hypothetical protein